MCGNSGLEAGSGAGTRLKNQQTAFKEAVCWYYGTKMRYILNSAASGGAV